MVLTYLSPAGREDQLMKNTLLTGVLVGTMLSTQVLAGESTCLTRNRLMSSRALGDNTIEMIDRNMNRFIVRTQNCPNLNDLNATIILGRSWRNLSCLNSTVTLNVAASGRGVNGCRVASVEAGSPSAG
jgi:hypothetical protein